MTRRAVVRIGVGALALVAVGALAFGPADPGNPPVVQEPQWDSPRTRELAVRACFDCHSNETKWPFYSYVPPFSWLVRHDVTEGRGELNFSEWNREQEEADEAADMLEDGEMPLDVYVWMHPEARLTAGEKQELVSGLERTLDDDEGGGEGGEDEEHFERGGHHRHGGDDHHDD